MPRAPGFWYRPPGPKAWALQPLAAIYAAGTAWRLARRSGMRLSVPVICVGNLTAGGTGKTPTVIALTQRLTSWNIRVHVVSRGYGGREKGPIRVDPKYQSAGDVGDEPLLMSAFAPVWVARDRAAGAAAAVNDGAQAILLDDGFQNPSLFKDMSIIVVDARFGFGNGLVIPSGPLREPVDVGLARTDFVLSLGTSEQQNNLPLPDSTKRLKGALRPLETGMNWQGLAVYAFAGIGFPEKFFQTLRELGTDLRGQVALADHQPLTPLLLSRLQSEAERCGAQLVTTEKDAVRLPKGYRPTVLTLPVRVTLENWDALDAALKKLF